MFKEITPQLLDCVMREKDHVIYYGDSPLRSPEGNEINHKEPRILKHLMIKMTISKIIDSQSVNSYAVFAFQKDFLEKKNDPLLKHFQQVIDKDKLVQTKLHKVTSKLIDVQDALDYLEENTQVLNLIFLGVSEIVTRMSNFLYEDISSNPYNGEKPDTIIDFLKYHYDELEIEYQSAVNILCAYHQAGIMLPLLLVKHKITPSEYANAMVAIHLNRSVEKNPASLPAIMGLKDKDNDTPIDWNHPDQGFHIFHQEALRVLEYLSFFDESEAKQSGIQVLIDEGESYHLEFKTSFRWDVHQEKKNPAVEHASLKTISAFLNSSGGNLLIGVTDDGSISGIETDRFDNEDKFLLHFWNMIKACMGQEVTPYIQSVIEKIDGKTVCRVNCLRSPSPVFLKQKGFDEEFFIRVGPSSAALEIREALKYIAERFPK